MSSSSLDGELERVNGYTYIGTLIVNKNLKKINELSHIHVKHILNEASNQIPSGILVKP